MGGGEVVRILRIHFVCVCVCVCVCVVRVQYHGNLTLKCVPPHRVHQEPPGVVLVLFRQNLSNLLHYKIHRHYLRDELNECAHAAVSIVEVVAVIHRVHLADALARRSTRYNLWPRVPFMVGDEVKQRVSGHNILGQKRSLHRGGQVVCEQRA